MHDGQTKRRLYASPFRSIKIDASMGSMGMSELKFPNYSDIAAVS